MNNNSLWHTYEEFDDHPDTDYPMDVGLPFFYKTLKA